MGNEGLRRHIYKNGMLPHSSFYIGLYGHPWVNFMEPLEQAVKDLMRLYRNKLPYAQRGSRAMKLILSTL